MNGWEQLLDSVVARFNYWVYIVLMMMGLFAMIAKKNLIKKLIGMSIFQTAIILFYVSVGVKENASIPILEDAVANLHVQSEQSYEPRVLGNTGSHIEAKRYANPLPHVLMLTAIVVGVSTLGVGLAIVQKIYLEYGVIEENDILARIDAENE